MQQQFNIQKVRSRQNETDQTTSSRITSEAATENQSVNLSGDAAEGQVEFQRLITALIPETRKLITIEEHPTLALAKRYPKRNILEWSPDNAHRSSAQLVTDACSGHFDQVTVLLDQLTADNVLAAFRLMARGTPCISMLPVRSNSDIQPKFMSLIRSHNLINTESIREQFNIFHKRC
jgi:type IV secretory pathway ATPase VirB11/archaellum biosynthesis ATPase